MEIIKNAQVSLSSDMIVCRVLDACLCTENCPEN